MNKLCKELILTTVILTTFATVTSERISGCCQLAIMANSIPFLLHFSRAQLW